MPGEATLDLATAVLADRNRMLAAIAKPEVVNDINDVMSIAPPALCLPAIPKAELVMLRAVSKEPAGQSWA